MDFYWIGLQFFAYVTGALEKRVVAKCDSLQAENEILTPFGLITHYVLFFIQHKTRKVVKGESTFVS
jgi:hypothetical protein